LLALLRDEQAEEDRMIQTDISDDDLCKLMDRSDLSGPPGATDAAPLMPLKGPGWEVVVPTKSGGGMLSSLTSWSPLQSLATQAPYFGGPFCLPQHLGYLVDGEQAISHFAYLPHENVELGVRLQQ
jgi:hypothetical protein